MVVKSRALLFTILGHVFVALGILGIFVPIMPTAPFVIASAFFYSKGSPRYEQWLLNHRQFGPLIRNWREHGAIHPRAKAVAILVLSSSVLSIGLLMPFASWLKLALTAFMGSVMVFILTRPSPPPAVSKKL